jgi:hypothetical protein
MPNISKARLMTLSLPLPEKTLLDQFEKFILLLWNQNDDIQLQKLEMDNNFNSLSQKAFKGELKDPS